MGKIVVPPATLALADHEEISRFLSEPFQMRERSQCQDFKHVLSSLAITELPQLGDAFILVYTLDAGRGWSQSVALCEVTDVSAKRMRNGGRAFTLRRTDVDCPEDDREVCLYFAGEGPQDLMPISVSNQKSQVSWRFTGHTLNLFPLERAIETLRCAVYEKLTRDRASILKKLPSQKTIDAVDAYVKKYQDSLAFLESTRPASDVLLKSHNPLAVRDNGMAGIGGIENVEIYGWQGLAFLDRMYLVNATWDSRNSNGTLRESLAEYVDKLECERVKWEAGWGEIRKAAEKVEAKLDDFTYPAKNDWLKSD